jgi:hypothetical protein
MTVSVLTDLVGKVVVDLLDRDGSTRPYSSPTHPNENDPKYEENKGGNPCSKPGIVILGLEHAAHEELNEQQP